MLGTIQKSVLLASAFLPTLALGAEIKAGFVDEARGVISIDVVYAGGCKKHDFQLDLQLCRETYPVQCEARLVDATNDDLCEAIVPATVEFPLKDFSDSYYSGGSLRITGDNNSSVNLSLPQ